MHIVIIGAGYAGLHTALNLSKKLDTPPDLARITLIERNPYHQHVSTLHLTAVGGIDHTEVAIPLGQILRRRAVRLQQNAVTQIDARAQQVVLDDGLALSYDRLVLALGSQTNDTVVPGAKTHTWGLRSFDEATALHEHIVRCFKEAVLTQDQTARQRLLTFAIVGGGFTGVQFAGELAHWAVQLCRYYGLPTSSVRVPLIERSAALLDQFGGWANNTARRVLAQRGVSLHLNTTVQEVREQTLVVADNKVIRTHTVVWAAGFRAPPLLAESGLMTDEQGRIPVDRYLRSKAPGEEAIFAAGDCAAIPDARGHLVPATASYALRQGEHLADVLYAEVMGEAPSPYRPLKLGQLVSLGPGEAIGDPLGVPASGPHIWLLKQGVEKWYLTTLWT